MSGQPSLSKSAATTPNPYRPPGFRMPACSETSLKVPSRLLWNSAFRPFGRPLGPHITGSPFQTQFGLRGDVGKLPVAHVAIQNVMAVVGHQHVGAAVVIVVGHADALSPAFLRDARLPRHLGEVGVPVVVIPLRTDVGR